MYIIIIGGGKVGSGAARDLLTAGHEVLVVEAEPATQLEINEELGEVALLGDGTEVRVQAEAGMNRADVVVAATGRDQANLAVCQVAKQRFNTPRVIARINDPRNEEIFGAVGVDVTVSATKAILSHIESELPSPGLIHLLEFGRSGLELVEVVLTDDAPSVGRTVGELDLPPNTVLTLVVHPDDRPEVPGPDSRLEAGATVLAVTVAEHEAKLRSLLTGSG